MPDGRTITVLLVAWSDGDLAARDELLPLVYPELHAIAARHFARERPGHLLQPTALVSEAYLRLVDLHAMRWQDRAHFYAMAARLMRRILVDHARQQQAAKRGAGRTQLTLAEGLLAPEPHAVDLLALDDALDRLADLDERQARIVELRAFVGLSVEEVARVLGVSTGTVKRDWTMARVWLRRALDEEGAET